VDTELSASKSEEVRIVLADDHPLIREALRHVLERVPDYRIVAEASDGEEAVRIVEDILPDVVIMDINMPKINGIEATKRIKTKCPGVAVLILTVFDDSEHIKGVLEAGAAGYLVKTVFGENVIHAVRGLVAGEAVLSPAALQRITESDMVQEKKPVNIDIGRILSGRELDILRLAARGMSNKEIAVQLGVSVRTVKGYLESIFSKLNAASRTEAVITALRNNIITLDDLK